MTFAEIVDATRARLGQRVSLSREENGRIRRTTRGELKPGIPNTTDAIPDDQGRVGFMIERRHGPGAPAVYGVLLDPLVVIDGREDRDGRRLRIELYGGSAFIIET
jgi:hypothetical protein